MSIKMPRGGLFDANGQATTAGHRYLVEIENQSVTLETLSASVDAINTALASLTNEVGEFPDFGSMATVNYEGPMTQAAFNALSSTESGVWYLIEEE